MAGKITIICAVAAEFKLGSEFFAIGRRDIGIVLQAPEWIENTLMFKWLVEDGSLKYVNSNNKVQMENEPLLGINAEGKEIKAEAEKKDIPVVEAVAAEAPKKAGRGRKPAVQTAEEVVGEAE